MYCSRWDHLLLFVLYAVLPNCVTTDSDLSNYEYNRYGYIEFIGPGGEKEEDNQPDLGEGFILDNIWDQSKEDMHESTGRVRRDANGTVSEEADEDDGSGDELGETTRFPPHQVPKLDNSSKTGGKPPLDPSDNTSVSVSITKTTSNQEQPTTPKVDVTDDADDWTSDADDVIDSVTTDNNSDGSAILQSASGFRWAPVIIAAVTSGLIFFFVGFFLNKFRKKMQDDQTSDYAPVSRKNGTDGFSHPEGVELHSIKTEGNPENKENRIYTGSEKASNLDRGVSLDDENKPLTENKVKFSTFKATSNHQSPINIDLAAVKYDEKLLKNVLTIKKEKKQYTLTNTGHTVKVEPDGESAVIAGGPLAKKQYLLDHFHFHWGSTDGQGSEHQLNGRTFSAEVHLVFSDTAILSFQEALRSERNDSLAVMAVFIEVGKENDKMKCLTDLMGSIQHKGDSTEIQDFDVTSILPANLSEYWSYHGSLTTSPYSENVLWIVYKQPIQLSHQQLDEFRKLTSRQKLEAADAEGSTVQRPTISDNFRKIQPLEDRQVFASFR